MSESAPSILQSAQFDATTQRIVDQLSSEPPVSVQVLSDELQQYVEELETHRTTAEMFDDGIAKRIAGLCWKLLDALPAQPTERQHRLTQIAGGLTPQNVAAAIRELKLDHLLDE